MVDGDPHIHVEANVVRANAAVRNVVASAFGLAGDLPSVVRTGCGVRVRYAMTSLRPESVTCLACREHARQQHLRFAEEVERLSCLPGVQIGAADAAAVAEKHRHLAERFSTGGAPPR